MPVTEQPSDLITEQVIFEVLESSGPGPTGLRGEDGVGATLTKIAGQTISGHRIVRPQADGRMVYASNLTVTDAYAPLYLATTSAGAAGQAVTVVSYGEVTEPTWGWVVGAPIFLGINGQLTQTPPTHPAFLLQVAACAVEPVTILFDPRVPALLA